MSKNIITLLFILHFFTSSGMNLQICFMNETLSDTESPGSEGEVSASSTCVNPMSTKAATPKSELPSERLPGGSMSSKVLSL